jgi:hypothetical protein
MKMGLSIDKAKLSQQIDYNFELSPAMQERYNELKRTDRDD